MKKLLPVALFAFLTLFFWSCTKEEKADTPTACFSTALLDSVKIKAEGLDSLKVDSIIKVYDERYFVPIPADSIYPQPVYFKYCGSSCDYKVIYTGDSSHIFVDSDKIDSSLHGPQAGADFSTSNAYKYAHSGSYKVTLVSSNVGDFGKDIKRSIAKDSIVINYYK